MNDMLTAGIVGIVPKLRYVMFTKRLLRELSPEAIEAILAHEIGHNYRKHLLIYPLILLGMIVCIGLFSMFFSDALIHFLTLEELTHPTQPWNIYGIIILFAIYASIIGLYFRFVFGLFSRLFERQADLHVYHLQIPPEHMILALDQVGIATGHSHRIPSWHHYSIQERIDFLKETIRNPSEIQHHHRRVKLFLVGYLLLLIIAAIILMAPFFL